jgi:hypothetical protein
VFGQSVDRPSWLADIRHRQAGLAPATRGAADDRWFRRAADIGASDRDPGQLVQVLA